MNHHSSAIETFASPSELNVIIETPKGSRNKYKYDEQIGIFRLHKMLTAGAVFPFDFGFVPSTRGPDGDPLDVLLLTEESVCLGSLVRAKLIGVIEADQTEKEETRRNDRLIGIASASHAYASIHALDEINASLLAEIEHFFVSYNEMEDRKFKVLGRFDATRAMKIIQAGQAHFESDRKGSKSGNRSNSRSRAYAGPAHRKSRSS